MQHLDDIQTCVVYLLNSVLQIKQGYPATNSKTRWLFCTTVLQNLLHKG